MFATLKNISSHTVCVYIFHIVIHHYHCIVSILEEHPTLSYILYFFCFCLSRSLYFSHYRLSTVYASSSPTLITHTIFRFPIWGSLFWFACYFRAALAPFVYNLKKNKSIKLNPQNSVFVRINGTLTCSTQFEYAIELVVSYPFLLLHELDGWN